MKKVLLASLLCIVNSIAMAQPHDVVSETMSTRSQADEYRRTLYECDIKLITLSDRVDFQMNDYLNTSDEEVYKSIRVDTILLDRLSSGTLEDCAKAIIN